MCIQCFEKKKQKHILIQGLRHQWWLFMLWKGCGGEMANMSDKIFPGTSNFKSQHNKHSNWDWGANNSMGALPAVPSAAPSKLPAEMMVWGCLCPAVMSLRLQPPCWESAAAWLPAMPGMSVSRQDWSCLCEAAPLKGMWREFLHSTRWQWMYEGLFGPKCVTLSSLM